MNIRKLAKERKLKSLQKRIQRMENMQYKIRNWLKQDREEAKKIMNE